MYFCDKGIVLRHRDISEYDRIVTIYTEENGRLEAIFKGVRKPKAKLRCFSEVMCHSDFRFYLSKYRTMPLCIGAGILNSYASLRNDLKKIICFRFVADIVIFLTPIGQKSYEKYRLILSSLNYLENAEKISKWFIVVFIMNFLEYFGTGFKETQVGFDSNLWNIIHTGFDRINDLDMYCDFYFDVLDFTLSNLNKISPFNFNLEKYFGNIVYFFEEEECISKR